MATDSLEFLLRRSPLTQSQRADVWDAYEGAQDADALAAKLSGMNVPKQVKASLWDLKEASAPKVAQSAPAVPEEPFPTPGETASTFAGGAIRAIPGMAAGMVEGATAPFLAIPREAVAAVRGQPSPTMTALRDAAGHVRAALAPGDAGPGRRLAEAASVIPGVAPVVQGAETILTPAYKTATGGVGTVKPAEMKAAAETGGAATAGLAMPEMARGVGAGTRGVVRASGGAGKVLEFSQKHAPSVAKAAIEVGMGHPIAAARTILGIAVNPTTLKAMGTMQQDAIITSVAAGDVEGAAAAVAKGIEKSPAAAKAMADALNAEAARVGATAEGPTTVPEMAPAKPIPSMRDTTPEAIKARAAERAARQRGALARSQSQVADRGTIVATPVVERAVLTLEKRATLPEKGKVTMPSVNTKPKGTGPIQRPLTPKQREMRMKQLEAAQAAGLDIWEAFGVEKP
jgi:hypothetical protein